MTQGTIQKGEGGDRAKNPSAEGNGRRGGNHFSRKRKQGGATPKKKDRFTTKIR